MTTGRINQVTILGVAGGVPERTTHHSPQ